MLFLHGVFGAAQKLLFYHLFKTDDTSNEILRFLTSCVCSLAITPSIVAADSWRETLPTGVAGAQMPVCVASGARRFERGFREFPNRFNQLGFVMHFVPLPLAAKVLPWFAAHAVAAVTGF